MKRIRQIIGSDRSTSSDSGFTLVEVIIAMVVFSIIAVSVAAAITNSLVISQDSRSRTVALNLASQDLDQARAVADVFAVVSKTWTTTVQGTTFTINRSVEWQSSDTTTTACGTGTGTLQYKIVRDTVTYPGAGTTNPVVTTTTLAPNSRINDPTLGSIVVFVTGASGAGVAGVTVSIAPTSTPNGAVALATAPAVTDSNGCSYALKVTPGNYNVTLSMTNGVDSSQVASPSKIAVVTAGTSSPEPFLYDTSAQLQLQYASNYSGSALLPTNLATSFTSTSGTYTSTTASSTSSVNLFPFTGGYHYETGAYSPVVPGATTDKTCLDPDPTEWTTPNTKTQAVGSSFVTAAASGTGNPTVKIPMGVVTLPALANTLGVLTGGLIPIYATSVSSTANGDPGCTAGMSYTFSTAAGTPTLALPFGTWKITVGTKSTAVTLTASNLKTAGYVNSDGTITFDPRGVTP
ncbi:hypothetical protein AX769_05940 [Frondihabitans sp. PAMC 28766]|uniref:prepilin-type N-terminal cleavage/methylation domain-containing protein n=1 Tax=Frondihabitans sp. PAMC 28766 TaxID=1795630 RepID=UPI00078D5542|nr:prepilin-type N-terminal cleavage/methylation domain-containing protein [Frondihabitans sp. PAMC 28766]AMM19774.1 hypothetical protein AX769_05940 [Frondihabitans sp. PAMC 28766]